MNRERAGPTGLGWFKNPVSSQTKKLMAATKFPDYLGLKLISSVLKFLIFDF